jgi:hypothetical protein
MISMRTLLSPQLSNCATWATAYQRDVKIISVSEFAIMIKDARSRRMERYKLDSFVRVQSKGKMIKTAPSDTLRPPLGASAIRPHAWHQVQPTSRPVDNPKRQEELAKRFHSLGRGLQDHPSCGKIITVAAWNKTRGS